MLLVKLILNMVFPRSVCQLITIHVYEFLFVYFVVVVIFSFSLSSAFECNKSDFTLVVALLMPFDWKIALKWKLLNPNPVTVVILLYLHVFELTYVV